MPSSLEPLSLTLNRADSLPFLFVGSGVSRRYLGHEDWRSLLTWAASLTNNPFQYYASRADNDLPQTASEIAATFHEIWWHDSRYRGSRETWQEIATNLSDPLRIEVAARLQAAQHVQDSDLAEELRLLGSCQLDGVITTNYDTLLEHTFPDYKVFVGQEDLLLSRSYQLAPIVHEIV